MMTLRELNNIIESIDVPIDRISGFCDQYEYMFDRCRVSVIKFLDEVVIETFCDAEEESEMEEKGFYPVPLMIEKLKAEAKCHGDYIVKLDGRDNDYDSRLVIRNVFTARVLHSGASAGISLLGPECGNLLNMGIFVARVIIEDNRAKNLNDTFCDFITLLYSFDGEANDAIHLRTFEDGSTYLRFIAWKESCAAVVAMLSSMFNGVYFTITPLTDESTSCSLSNDCDHKWFAPWQAVVYPAYLPDPYDSELESIDGIMFYRHECGSKQEALQFINDHHYNESVGDMSQIISTRYINDPQELIMGDEPLLSYIDDNIRSVEREF